MSETRFDLRRDGLGIVLFTAGAFFSVLMIKALAGGVPLPEAGGTALLARIWTASLGAFPSLVFTAGIAILGARLFVVGPSPTLGTSLLRHAGRLAFAGVGLAILLGAFSETAGGALGDLTGGTVARWTHVAAGALVGLAVLTTPLWLARLQSVLAEGRVEARGSGRGSELGSIEAMAADDEGVSAAEAAALVPEPLPRPAPVPAPHVPDVRLRGEVPAGARALASDPLPERREEPAIATAAPAAHHWTPAPVEIEPEPVLETEPVLERAEQIFAADEIELDELEPAHGQDDDFEDDVVAEDEIARAEPEADAELDPDELEIADVPPVEVTRSAATYLAGGEAAHAAASARELAPVPPPGWEQSSLFETDEEPVDAYGTPATLVDAILHPLEGRAGASPPDVAEEAGDADDAAEQREVVLKPKPAPRKRASRAAELAGGPAGGAAEGRTKLLAEAGCLFLDQGRVAVSMLQKEYDMDFDEACRVLDELQDLGLIGPYLGGQRRDILLTRDQWMEKVSALG